MSALYWVLAVIGGIAALYVVFFPFQPWRNLPGFLLAFFQVLPRAIRKDRARRRARVLPAQDG